MVNVQINVQNPTGQPIAGIPLQIHVIPDILTLGTYKPYNLIGITDSLGEYILTQAQIGAEFITVANPSSSSNYSSNFGTSTGSTSTSLFSGGYLTLELQPAVPPTLGTCPNEYTLNSSGMCIKQSEANTLLTISWLDILLIVGIVIALVYFFYLFKHKKSKPLFTRIEVQK
jgi:hypothetical protein